MSEFNHTKGPWHAVGSMVEHESDIIADICSCNPDVFEQFHEKRAYSEQVANARLIAQSPALLVALTNLVSEYEKVALSTGYKSKSEIQNELLEARAVIAKVRGK